MRRTFDGPPVLPRSDGDRINAVHDACMCCGVQLRGHEERLETTSNNTHTMETRQEVRKVQYSRRDLTKHAMLPCMQP